MSNKSRNVRLGLMIHLTLLPDASCDHERTWSVITNALSNWYRKGDGTCTLVNTVDGKTFMVKELPEQIDAKL